MTPLEVFLSHLEATGLRYYQSGPSFMAQCPSHDDDTPSLRIAEADDRVLLYCNGGCQAGQIVGDLGLQLRDLFAPRDTALPRPKPKLVPVAGGGMATRAAREVIERETLALVREWADAFVPPSVGVTA